MPRRGVIEGLAYAVLLALAIGIFEREARACGVFAAETSESASRLPYLTVERVLIVWDKDTETEDFIREARFDQANLGFGFVVPVPSRPEVFTVTGDPFSQLARAYRFMPEQPQGSGGALGGGAGAGGMAPAPVEVLAHARLGDLTASVLSATDGGGLEAWLREHGFGVEPGARAWLDHYVKLGFYYVAFHYAGTAAPATGRLVSRTVRIRFKTPVAYYPYSEPVSAPLTRTSRLLEGWFASQVVAAPFAMRITAAGPEWLRPWEGPTYPKTSDLATQLPMLKHILPSAPLYVTPFRDAKLSRAGWGDVLLIPIRLGEDDDADVAERWPLMGVLDPRLDDQVRASPTRARTLFPASAQSARAESPPAPRAIHPSCTASASAPDSGPASGWSFFVALAGAWRRRTARCVRSQR